MAKKVVGILGGMGPEATALFFSRIVSITPASCDQEHIPIVIYNNPQIPDRTASIRNRDTSIIKALEASLRILEKSAPDFICIPCNTVHFYFDEMQRCTSIPIINLVETVAEVALIEHPELERIGLLATTGTIKSELYQSAFARRGVQLINPEKRDCEQLQDVIRALKGHPGKLQQLQPLAAKLMEQGAQGIVLGCTELSLISQQLTLEIPVFDSIEILAKRAVQLATNHS